MTTSDSWQSTGTHLHDAEWADGTTPDVPIAGKRIFDVALSVTGLGLGLPLLAIAAAAVRLESRGPVFRRTTCWGQGARPFERLRLRTIDGTGQMTCAGRAVVRLGLDRLPELFNVIRGQMSIIGPSAVSCGQCDRASLAHLRRFAMRPGMTGFWAIGAGHSGTREGYFSPEENYWSHWSVWRDLALLGRALGGVVAGSGE